MVFARLGPMTTYVPLHCLSHYSFLEGASSPTSWIQEIHKQRLPAVAITDRCGVYGLVEAHQKAKELNVKLIVGSSFTISGIGDAVCLVKDKSGYHNLCALITKSRLRCVKGTYQTRVHDLCDHADGLVLIAPPTRLLADAFNDNLYTPIGRYRQPSDADIEHERRKKARSLGVHTVAANQMLYHHRQKRPLQDIMTCIRHKTNLRSAGTRLFGNAEHGLLSPRLMASLFDNAKEDLERSIAIAEQCLFSLDELKYRYPLEALPNGENSTSWLHKLVYKGAQKRYPQGIPQAVHAQINKELSLITELQYGGYFLTMYEIARYCREQNILCQGRGSAANSIVCYCLHITAVDPVSMNLLFERFISKERSEPPDIDLDIEHNRREEVIQHVYTKYGRDKAAMVCNVVRYRPKSAIRDVGKALGLPLTQLDRIAKLIGRHSELKDEFFSGMDPHTKELLLKWTQELLDTPRHLSIHSGGFILGDRPLSQLVPVENATMPGRTVIQWDKNHIEALGLFKVDLLALGALHQLHRSFDLISKHHGRDVTMATLPQDDPDTYTMISSADTIGVFQIESRAQMSMLPRLRPKAFYDLVIEISLVRPGPITGGMVHPYLRRRRKKEKVTYPHPLLKPVLERTLGVPLFQEQVMRLAMIAADYTPGESDQLRRDMAAWRRKGRIEKHHERLVSRMKQKGIEESFAERVFEQIKGFGEYGFPESHAASFALIAYATSWVKCHYPAIFACSLLNSQPMGFYSPSTIVWDAMRHGIEVLPICVNQSQWECTIVKSSQGDSLRMGISYIEGLGTREREKITAARHNGPFADTQDFIKRTRVHRRAQESLASSGAFSCFGVSRRNALWQAQAFSQSLKNTLPLPTQNLRTTFNPIDRFDTILWDVDSSSHSTHGHPLAPMRQTLLKRGLRNAQAINRLRIKTRVHYAGIVICRQSPHTASGVTFLTLEDESGFINVVIWQKVFEKHASLLKTTSFLGVSGELQVEEGVVHLVAHSLWQPPTTLPAPAIKSRDFH